MARQAGTQKPASMRGRFGRTGPGGMPTSSSGRSAGRVGGSGAGRSVSTRRKPRSRKGTQGESGLGKAMSALGGLSGGKATKKAAGRSAKPAGLALLAGAAGLALKNRDKLKHMAERGRSSSEPQGITENASQGTTDSPYQGSTNSTDQGTAPGA